MRALRHLLTVCALCWALPLWAQAYPVKPVRIVLGYPIGGSADFIARSIMQDLAQELGQPIIIDNRPGAGTNIASELVAQAAPDGYTLLLGNNSSHGINKALYKKLAFDPTKDFIPISRVGRMPLIIAVNGKLGVRSLQELIERVKAKPGAFNFASSGNGSPNHLAGVLFNSLTGGDMVHVPYRGGGPSAAATAAGETQVMFGTPPTVLPHISSGRLVSLSTTTTDRSIAFPDVPSAAEAGLRNFNVDTWFALFAPKGTPAAIVTRVFDAIIKVLAKPEVKKRLAAGGVEASPSASPAAFDAALRVESPFWENLVRQSGATVD